MIRNSFIFLPRIGPATEKRIWNQGITDWDSFLKTSHITGMSDKAKSYHERIIRNTSKELYRLNSAYFSSLLPEKHHWRLYPFFREDAVFLDIETSGASRHDDVTVIGMYDGIDTKIMLQGINLNLNALRNELSRYKIIVTFNGSSFDLPFIRKRYPEVIPRIPHIDIRHVCDKIGLTGGLKEIEKKLGLSRDPLLERFYSGDPYRLWRMYRATGDEHYLNLLISYNEDDVINLKTIADHAIPLLWKSISPFSGL